MPAPTSITELSTAAASNGPNGATSVLEIDNYMQAHAAFIAQLRDDKVAETDLAASAGAAMVGFQELVDGAVTRTVQDRLRDTGVSPDGLTGADDSAKMQAAINGGATYIRLAPGKTYTWEGVLGASNLTIDARGSKIVHKANATLPALKFEDKSNFHIVGGEWDGNQSNQTTAGLDMVLIYNNCTDFTFQPDYMHDAKRWPVFLQANTQSPRYFKIAGRYEACGGGGPSTNGATEGLFLGVNSSNHPGSSINGISMQGGTSKIRLIGGHTNNNGGNGIFFGSANNCRAIGWQSNSNGTGATGGSGYGLNTSSAGTCYKNYIIECEGNSNADDGVDINNAAGAENSYHRVIGGTFESNNSAINCINSHGNLFDGISGTASRLNGIHLQNSDRNIVKNPRLLNNGATAANTYHGIYIDGTSDNNQVHGGVSTNDGGAANQKYGLYIDTGASANMVRGIDCNGNATGSINDDGTGTIFNDNSGFQAPSVFAKKNANQTIATATETKVTFQANSWNIRTLFDHATSRWTPKQLGKYQLTAQLMFAAAVDQKLMDVYIKKNGTTIANGRVVASGTGYHLSQATAVADVTAATDYFEIYTYQNSGVNLDVASDGTQTFFCGHKLPY